MYVYIFITILYFILQLGANVPCALNQSKPWELSKSSIAQPAKIENDKLCCLQKKIKNKTNLIGKTIFPNQRKRTNRFFGPSAIHCRQTASISEMNLKNIKLLIKDFLYLVTFQFHGAKYTTKYIYIYTPKTISVYTKLRFYIHHRSSSIHK